MRPHCTAVDRLKRSEVKTVRSDVQPTFDMTYHFHADYVSHKCMGMAPKGLREIVDWPLRWR